MGAKFGHWMILMLSAANFAFAEPADLTEAVRQKAIDKLEADIAAAAVRRSLLHGRPGTVVIKAKDASPAPGVRPPFGGLKAGTIRVWTNPNIKAEKTKTDLEFTEVSREEDALVRELREFFKMLDTRTTESWTDANVELLRKMHLLKSDAGVSLIAKQLRDRIPGLKSADEVLYLRAVRLWLNRYQRTVELMGSATLSADSLNQALDSGVHKFQANLSAKWGEKYQRLEEERIQRAMSFGTHSYVALMRSQLWTLRNGSAKDFSRCTANVTEDVRSIFGAIEPQPLVVKSSPSAVAPSQAQIR